MLELTWGAGTHTGLRRKRNEDAHLVAPPLFVVADGMGGHEKGDVAARLAVETLAHIVTAEQAVGAPTESVPVGPAPSNAGRGQDGGDLSVAVTRAAVLDAVRAADREIWARSEGDAHRTMGTTLCGLISLPDGDGTSVLVFNVGDSRVYRLRDRQLVQLTHDHSVVQELIDEGRLLPDEAESHPERNVITRSLGSGEPVEVDWWSVQATTGDTFLLCSDGLVKEVAVQRVAAVLGGDGDAQARADRLIEEALAGGGRDNVTVVVVDVVGAGPGPTSDLTTPTGERVAGLVVDTNPRGETPQAPPVEPPPDMDPSGDEAGLIDVGDVPISLSTGHP